MASHTIKIIGADRYLTLYKTYLNEALHSCDYHEAIFYLNGLAHLTDWNENESQAKVDTLEQYFALLEVISEMSDGDYTICDYGHTIELN